MRTFTTLLFGLTIFSCNQTQTTDNKVVAQDTIVQTQPVKDKLVDNVTQLLNKALTSDTVEFNNEFEFDTYKSFLFLNQDTYSVKLKKMLL